LGFLTLIFQKSLRGLSSEDTVTIFHQENKGRYVVFIAINWAFLEWEFTPIYHIHIPKDVEKIMPLFSLFSRFSIGLQCPLDIPLLALF